MKTLLASLGLVVCAVLPSWAQQRVNVVSFEHVLRWETENRFPNYFNDPVIKDSVLNHLSTALKTYLKAGQVLLPSTIKYRTIQMFGNAKNQKPDFNSASPDYDVSVLSFLTKSTVGFGVEWNLDIKIYQGKKTVFDKTIHHEIEYFSSSGYMTAIPWFSKEEFVHFLSDMTKEMFSTIPALPKAVTVGSPAVMEADIYKWIPQAKRILLKTDGNWKQGAKFLLAIQQDNDTLSSLLYKQGMEIGWPQLTLSSIAAEFVRNEIGIEIGHTNREKIIRNGKVKLTGGLSLRIRMEWVEVTRTLNSLQSLWGVSSTTQKEAPMVAELYKDNSLQGQYTYYKTNVINASGSGLNLYVDPLTMNIGTHYVYGMMLGQPIRVRYEENKATIALGDDQQIRAAMVMLNVNPASREFSNQKISENKKFVTSTSGGKVSENKATEWYYFYYDIALSAEDLNRYLQSLVCLFAGMSTEPNSN